MIDRIRQHMAAGRDVFAYFKHEETPEGALYAVELLREVSGAEAVGDGERDVASYVSTRPFARHLLQHFSWCPITRHTTSLLLWLLRRTRACFPAFSTTCASRRGWRRFPSAPTRPTFCSSAEFLEKHKRLLLTARRNDVREFLQQLFSHQVDGRSVGRKLSALRHLYRYLLLDKKIEHDPTLNIESPRQWKVLPKSLARDEVESTLAAPAARCAVGIASTKEAAALAVRDRAMLELLYAGALRVSEMVNATLEDLKLEVGIHAGARQGRQGAHCAAGQAGAGCAVGVSGARAARAGRDASGQAREECRREYRSVSDKNSPLLFIARGGRKLDAAAGVADGGGSVGCFGTACIAAHAAAFLRDAHGGEWRGPAHGADDSWPRGYFDHAGVHASGAGSAADRVSEASSEGEGEVILHRSKSRSTIRREGRG